MAGVPSSRCHGAHEVPALVTRCLSLSVLLVCQASALAQVDWPNVGNDKGAMRYSSLAQITRENVHDLEAVWTFHTGGLNPAVAHSAIQCTPIVVDGVMYLTAPDTQVIAVDAARGATLALRSRTRIETSLPYNRGVAYWSENRRDGARRILFATPEGSLYSLDARTGRPDPHFGRDGIVDLREGIARDLRNLAYGVTAAPASSKTSSFSDSLSMRGTSADRATCAPSTFGPDPMCGGFRRFLASELGHETWKGASLETRGGVNAWSGVTVDVGRGLILAGLGSAGFDFHGGDRHGDNLFANSVVALDARTGRRVWHYQLVHHDIWDYDLPWPPPRHGAPRRQPIDAAAQITKQGFVFLFDRPAAGRSSTCRARGAQVRFAGSSRRDSACPRQAACVCPPGLQRAGHHEHFGRGERVCEGQARGRSPRLAVYSTEPAGTVYSPGTIGGGTWSGASFDPTTGLLFVNGNNFPRVLKLSRVGQSRALRDTGFLRLTDHRGYPGVKPPWGTLTAIDPNRGKNRWQVPSESFPSSPRGASRPQGRQTSVEHRHGRRPCFHRRDDGREDSRLR